jgi:Tol biopolymer transport system component
VLETKGSKGSVGLGGRSVFDYQLIGVAFLRASSESNLAGELLHTPQSMYMATKSKSLSWGACFLLFIFGVTCAATPSGRMTALAMSPDGKFVVVTYERGDTAFIYRVSVDTGDAIRMTDAKTGEELSPSLSADGKQIAYTYLPGNGIPSRIVIVNADGSDPRQWSPSGSNDSSPVFSPDSKTIIFGRPGYYGNYSPIAQPYWHDWNFYVGCLDGTAVRQLTHEHFYAVSPISVSPDGGSFLFVNHEEKSDVIEIRSLEDPPKPTQTLRPDLSHKIKLGRILNDPNYMPDGKSVLLMAASDGKRGRYDYDVYRMDLATGTVERLTNGNGYATDLKVSADGRTAAFLKWSSNWRGTPVKNELYLLDLQSHKLTPLRVSAFN